MAYMISALAFVFYCVQHKITLTSDYGHKKNPNLTKIMFFFETFPYLYRIINKTALLKPKIMKTLNKNTKLTDNEVELLTSLFESGVTLYRKVKLYGAGHPQLPSFFGTNFQENESGFWEDHDTTHAKFISYNSIGDMMKDSGLHRSDFANDGQELSISNIPIYR